MDKKKSILNVSVSLITKIITMVMVVVVKRYLIQICGNEVNGLNALYLSIIGVLTVAELGVGSAITFCMYKPIVEGDSQKVAALYGLFQKIYMLVGVFILIAGLMLTPFIHFFAADYAQLNVNLYITFVLMLISIVLTYFYGAKSALINAHKNNYITTAITSGGTLLQYVLQIVVLLLTRSFVAYLICRIVAAVVQWLLTEIVARRKYNPILRDWQKVDKSTKKELTKSVKAMFMHQIGYVLVNTVDSVIISFFVGVVALGEYSNYATIMTSMTAVLKMIFSSLTSVLGHLFVEKTRETSKKYCEAFHLLNFAVGTVFFLGYYAVIDSLVAILFDEGLIVAKAVSLAITVNGFVQFMRSGVLAFRDATGTFYYDRWKPLVEGIVNIVLSIVFVKLVGVAGVIVATIITNLLICHVVEPYVLYKHAFKTTPKWYYLRNYTMMAAFGVALLIMDNAMQPFANHWTTFFVNGCISVGISAVICAIVLAGSRDLRELILQKLKRR